MAMFSRFRLAGAVRSSVVEQRGRFLSQNSLLLYISVKRKGMNCFKKKADETLSEARCDEQRPNTDSFLERLLHC